MSFRRRLSPFRKRPSEHLVPIGVSLKCGQLDTATSLLIQAWQWVLSGTEISLAWGCRLQPERGAEPGYGCRFWLQSLEP